MINKTSKIKTISRKVEFKGWHSLETVVVQAPSMKHDGYSEPLNREVFQVGRVAIILLYLPETDKILFNQQFRVGAFMAGDENPWLYECAGGMIDEGETPEESAYREAFEETGCRVQEVEFIGKVYSSPGCLNETFFLYCGRISNAEAGHHGLEDEGEEIKTHLISSDDAIHMLDNGKIMNGNTVMCLHWFARNRDRLRQKWK